MFITEAQDVESAVRLAIKLEDLEIGSISPLDPRIDAFPYIVETNYGKLYCEPIFGPPDLAVDPTLPMFIRVSTFAF